MDATPATTVMLWIIVGLLIVMDQMDTETDVSLGLHTMTHPSHQDILAQIGVVAL